MQHLREMLSLKLISFAADGALEMAGRYRIRHTVGSKSLLLISV